MEKVRHTNSNIVVLGAGLAGLSFAYHFKGDCILFDKEREPGGMARSIKKDGYIFDYDGHLLHFKNEWVFKLVSTLLNGNIAPHKRDAWVYSKGIYTRYPFQANFYGLPKQVVKDCLLGLIKAKLPVQNSSSNGNFEHWILNTFGEGIAQHFMLPYNRKFWTIEPKELNCEWLDGFVPVPNIEDTVIGAISENTKPYGYNSKFWYPVKGGISELSKCFLSNINKAFYPNKKAVTVDQHRGEVVFEDASIKKFKRLVSTMPLPELGKMLVNLPKNIEAAFSKLRWTSIFVVNLGVDKENISEKHWVYYPEEDFVFYRIGFSSNFSADIMPPKKTAMYVETAYSKGKAINKNRIIDAAIQGLEKAGILSDEKEIEVCLPMDIEYGYVIYDEDRKEAVRLIKDYLEKFGIWTIGRYGSWKYMSMEDVIVEGKELAEMLAIRKN